MSLWLILEGQADQGRQRIRQAIVVFDYLTETERTFSMEREVRIRQLRERLSWRYFASAQCANG